MTRDLAAALQTLAAGGRIGRAVVTALRGSAPRQPGATLLVREDGAMAGSVSGGCVEAAIAGEVQDAMRIGEPRVRRYGVSDEMAWSIGLACGGTIEVLIEPDIRPYIREAVTNPAAAVVATVLGGRLPVGSAWLFREDGTGEGPVDSIPGLATAARAAFRTQSSSVVTLGEEPVTSSVFIEMIPRQPRLLIVGAVQVAATLVPMAKQVGYYTIVADGRDSFLNRERFPDADELILGWPEEAFARVGIDAATYVCVLSHDPRFDDPAISLALRSAAAYVGAIGSRKTQAARRERLGAAGFGPRELARLHGPIGLDLGGKEPAEIALAILAEMTMARYGKLPA
ncbi:MAG: XdhC family protein [Gemmatimonadota bacterium]